MDTCKQCGAEISPAEGYYNDNRCNACAFGLPDSEVAFGGGPAMNFEPKWTPTTYERIPYAPHNSTMHDERCDCPWCMPSEPDGLSDEEVAQLEDDPNGFTDEQATEWEEQNDVRDAMESFNEVPSYFERFQDLAANRRFFLNEEEFARDDAHDLAEMILTQEQRMAAKQPVCARLLASIADQRTRSGERESEN